MQSGRVLWSEILTYLPGIKCGITHKFRRHYSASALLCGIKEERIGVAALLERLTTQMRVGILSNMKAKLLLKERHQIHDHAFVELRVWQVPQSVSGYTYALVYAVSGECVLRYDNEAGKGDHKHRGDREMPYRFTTPERLLADFLLNADQWRSV